MGSNESSANREAGRTSLQYLVSIVGVSIAALSLATASVARVIGADDRRIPGAEESDLMSALGLIFCSRVIDDRRRIGAGTATVVGSRSTILTAAHLFTDPAGSQGPRIDFDPLAECTFRQYDSSGELAFETGFTQATLGEYRRNGGAPNQDWAVLRISEPLPMTSLAVPFADEVNLIQDTVGLPVRILAFHADIRGGRRTPMISEGSLFAIDYLGSRRLAHTADMERMSSGAAIVYRTEGGTDVVVGINRSAANLGDFNLAVPMSTELREALRSFAHGLVPLPSQRLAWYSACGHCDFRSTPAFD